jgi:predicted DNA-binding transcriptional regulator YafY
MRLDFFYVLLLMGVTKSAYLRYLAYDKCLTNTSRRFTWKDLITAANYSLATHSIDPIKKAQFFRDKDALKSPPWNAPLLSENGFYKYEDPNFSIVNQPLNDAEAEQIKSALMVLTRFKGLPQFEWVHEIIPKIAKHFDLDNLQTEIIGFDQNIDVEGLNYFEPIFNAIINKQVLSIQYQSFKSSNPSKIVINPYYLKQYNNRWFQFGYVSEFKKLINLALDRIKGVDVLEKEAFTENTVYDFNEYFEDIIGVTKYEDKPLEWIKLWFAADQADYIKTKPLHGTQHFDKQKDGSAFVRFQVIPNVELEQLILRFGEHCKVLEPLELAAKISERIKEASKLY